MPTLSGPLSTAPNASLPAGAKRKRAKDGKISKKALGKFLEEEANEPEHKQSGAAKKLAREVEGDSDPLIKSYVAGLPIKGVTGDSALTIAFDRESVRSFDSDGRMDVAEVNITKEQIRPYRGKEIPGWDEEKGVHELGLDPERVYQMYCPADEIAKAAATANSVQLLKKHVPVDASDHRKYDIVGTTGSDARFEAPYLKNSLKVWSKEGIDLIESDAQKEISAGYHYVPEMTPGNFGGNHYDGIMRNIEFNHVALVSEGRAGPDVVVGDEAMRNAGANHSGGMERKMTPTRLEYLAVTRAARIINPQLAMDATVELGPIFSGLTSANVKARTKKIVADAKKALKGKTVAKDASLESLAKLLDSFETAPENDKKSLDESVSGPQHRAMEAAAHGHSNIGIPKNVGAEFERADKGKTFSDAVPEFLKGKGLSDDDCAKVMDMLKRDEMPENALDEEEETNIEVEEGEDAVEEEEGEDSEMEEASDGEIEEEEAEDESEEEAKKAAKDAKAAKDKKAKDAKPAMGKKPGGMDAKPKPKNLVTLDAMEKAIKLAVDSANARALNAQKARATVRPFVGELPLGLDSATKVFRSAAKIMAQDGRLVAEPKEIDALPALALQTLIKTCGKASQDSDGRRRVVGDAAPSAADGFELFPEARRIGMVS